jgi:hypothetical protein
VWCFHNPLGNSGVIPGKLARPGSQDLQRLLDFGFLQHDGKEAHDY